MSDNNPPEDVDIVEEEYSFDPIRLREGLEVNQLHYRAGGATLDIDPRFLKNGFSMGHHKPDDEEDEMQYSINNSEVINHLQPQCEGFDDGSDDEDDERSPFQKMVEKMEKVIPDGGVMKKIIQEGTGERVPEGALTTFHFNGYLEYNGQPYDSTWLRGKPYKGKIGMGMFFIGLEVAVLSMKAGEESEFLIHYDYAYGEYGCPPRIPGNATIFCIVKVFEFTDCRSAEKIAGLSSAELNEYSYDKILEAAENECKTGNDLYKRGSNEKAIVHYKRGVTILDNSQKRADKKNKELKTLSVRLYVNLAACYDRLEQYRQVLIATDAALELEESNIKALFRKGKALRMLTEFEAAESLLKEACRLHPDNQDLTAELRKVKRQIDDCKVAEIERCRRMFQGSSPEQLAAGVGDIRITSNNNKNDSDNIKFTEKETDCSSASHEVVNSNKVPEEFIETVNKKLYNFLSDDSMQSIPYPMDLSVEKSAYLASVLNTMKLSILKKPNGDTVIAKPANFNLESLVKS